MIFDSLYSFRFDPHNISIFHQDEFLEQPGHLFVIRHLAVRLDTVTKLRDPSDDMHLIETDKSIMHNFFQIGVLFFDGSPLCKTKKTEILKLSDNMIREFPLV